MKPEINSTNGQPFVDGSLLAGETFEHLANQTDDTSDMTDFELSETALFVVSFMHGIVFRQRLDEQGKPNPDLRKLHDLEAEIKQIRAEQDLVYSGDKATKRLVISNYAPRVREAIQAQKELLPHG
jgi:hypothetical protein